MNIEPLGSATAYQAQAVVKPQRTEQQDAGEKEIRDENTVAKQTPIDQTTLTVNSITDKENGTAGQEQESYKQQQISHESIRKAVEKMNLKMSSTVAEFGIHEGTNRITIKIVDKDTKEVIKELPPEKTLDMIAKAWEIAGILVDETR